MENKKPIERSVDSLQRIYSLVLALSIGQAISVVVLDASTKQFLPLSIERIIGPEGVNFFKNVVPIGAAFLVTIIPFHQGMNRHLDVHYIESMDPSVGLGLFVDFWFFMFEGGMFFAIASSIRQPVQAYVFFGLLLLIDIVWAFIAKAIHRSASDRPITKWPGINLLTLTVGVILLSFSFVGEAWKAWLLFLLVLGRTVLDYKTSWDFYFPFDSTDVVEDSELIRSSN